MLHTSSSSSYLKWNNYSERYFRQKFVERERKVRIHQQQAEWIGRWGMEWNEFSIISDSYNNGSSVVDLDTKHKHKLKEEKKKKREREQFKSIQPNHWLEHGHTHYSRKENPISDLFRANSQPTPGDLVSNE
jgi:hypothetical protein